MLSTIKIMKYLIICILCLMAILSNPLMLDAQNKEIDASFSPKIIVKYSVLSIVEPENTFQVGVEYLYRPKIAFQQQLGYTFNTPISQNNIRGIRSRSEMRFYYTNGNRAQAYVAPEILYKFLQQYGTRTFWREEGAYQQVIDFQANRNVIGFMPKIGLTNNILDRKFAIDFALGIGVKATYYRSNVPGDVFNEDFFFADEYFNSRLRNNGHEVLPNFYFGLLIGFVAK